MARRKSAFWLVSEPTPMMSEVVGVKVVSSGSTVTAAWAAPAESTSADTAREAVMTPVRDVRTNIGVRSL